MKPNPTLESLKRLGREELIRAEEQDRILKILKQNGYGDIQGDFIIMNWKKTKSEIQKGDK
jgi:hypothetical protein